ncbi:ash family protein [Salmonella enterica subsp. enterica serovar Durban]|nr:ash family protein [Salmonella enterica]EHL0893937.1 ash family protein [Salmonella enterica subsp. enterica serovar Durban]EHM6003936.1 ash family protein [Salmonella enterica]EHM6168837.1 ash family protein [Salmonella enterica]EHM9267785.1 ash family protein [Salmonella enterica]
MTTYKNRLPAFGALGYISPAPHKTGAGIGTPLTTYAHNRVSGFFTCAISPHLYIMVGRMGPLSGGPGSCVAGSSNPVRLATQSLEPLGGELSQLTTYEGAISWLTVNNAVPALTLSASTPRPKSTAACTAPTIWRISCVSKCSPVRATAGCYGCRQSWTTSPTISAMFRRYLTNQRTPRNNTTNRLPLLFAAGGLRTPVVREILL